MALYTLYNYNPTAPTQITRELHSSVGAGNNILGDVRRAFLVDTDFEIWDSPAGGTQLVEAVDYTIIDKDFNLTAEAGLEIWSGYRIVTPAYQACPLYFTYKIVMSYNDAALMNLFLSALSEIGNLIYASAVATPAALIHGTAGQLLRSGGHGAPPDWSTVKESAGALSLITTIGMSGPLTNTHIGSKPIDVTSFVVCDNLNADLLDGQHASALMPVGSVLPYGGAAAPTGFLLCDGSQADKTTYAALFAITGHAFGADPGGNKFILPDLQGRAPAGAGTSAGGTDVTHVAETLVLGTKYNDKMQSHFA